MSDPIITDAIQQTHDALVETDAAERLGYPIPDPDVIAGWEPVVRGVVYLWATARTESARAELEFEDDQPDVLDDWQDACSAACVSGTMPPPRPDPWRSAGGPILSQRGQLAEVEEWTDRGRVADALADDRTHPKAAARLKIILIDLNRIAEIETQLRADAVEQGARVALWPVAEADLGDIEKRATANRGRSSAGAASEAQRVLALAPTLALAAAREGMPAAEALPFEDEPPAADLVEQRLQLRSEQWRGGDDPELVALLRAIPPLSVVLECGGDVGGADVIARAVLEIEGLRRKIDRQAEEATSLRIEIADAWAALGGPRPGRPDAAIRKLQEDLDGKERAINNLHVALSAPVSDAPVWGPHRTDADGVELTALRPVLLASITPRPSGGWWWATDEEEGTAKTLERAQSHAELAVGAKS